jgi:hypothetical protein
LASPDLHYRPFSDGLEWLQKLTLSGCLAVGVLEEQKISEHLMVALKADIDEETWATLNSTTSRPFSHPSTGKIAIKVTNAYGDEVLRVLGLPEPQRR